MTTTLGVTETTIYRWLSGEVRPLWAFHRRMNPWWRELELEEERSREATPDPAREGL